MGYSGNIYVIDYYNGCIKCFNLNGDFLHNWGNKGRGDGEFNLPTGIAVDVCDGISKSIMNEMQLVDELKSYPWRAFKINIEDLDLKGSSEILYKNCGSSEILYKNYKSKAPSGLLSICAAYIGIERIYVADYGNHRIQVFEMDGDNIKFIGKWGGEGSDDGKFVGPHSCAIGYELHNGNKVSVLYVSDQFNNRIQVISSDGKFIRKWGSIGDGDYNFNHPQGIYISRDFLDPNYQMIYIADRGNNRVACYRISHKGEIKIVPNWIPLNIGCSPNNITVDGNNGVVYVSYNDCIYKYKYDGLRVHGLRCVGTLGSDKQLNEPRGMAKGMRQMLYVADSLHERIVLLDY